MRLSYRFLSGLVLFIPSSFLLIWAGRRSVCRSRFTFVKDFFGCVSVYLSHILPVPECSGRCGAARRVLIAVDAFFFR